MNNKQERRNKTETLSQETENPEGFILGWLVIHHSSDQWDRSKLKWKRNKWRNWVLVLCNVRLFPFLLFFEPIRKFHGNRWKKKGCVQMKEETQLGDNGSSNELAPMETEFLFLFSSLFLFFKWMVEDGWWGVWSFGVVRWEGEEWKRKRESAWKKR